MFFITFMSDFNTAFLEMTINDLRRSILRGLTSGIGNRAKDDLALSKISYDEIKRVLLCRPNGRLGNQLLMTPLVKEVAEDFPDCKIDLFVKGNLARILFKNYPQVDRIIRLPGRPFRHLWAYMKVWIALRRYTYDLIVNVTPNSSSGRLATSFSRGKYRLYCEIPEEVAQNEDYMHMAKKPVYCLRALLKRIGWQDMGKPISELDIKLNAEDMRHGAEVLKGLVKNDKPTISLYTYATGAKCFSKDWWLEFYGRLKERFGDDYNFVEILPVENVSQIDFREISFYSRDLFEIAAVMANTEMYIGADCGIMHLAGAAHIPVLGLFSMTDPRVYQVYNAHSVAIKTSDVTDMDEIIEKVDEILKKRHTAIN